MAKILHPATLIINGRVVLQGASFMDCAKQLASQYPNATLAPLRYDQPDKNSPLMTGIDRKRANFYLGARISFKMRIPGQTAMVFAMIVRYVSPEQLSAGLTTEEKDSLQKAIAAGVPSSIKSRLFNFTHIMADLYAGYISSAHAVAVTLDPDCAFTQHLKIGAYAYHSDYFAASYAVTTIPSITA